MKISLFLIAFNCVSTIGLTQFSATLKNVVSGKERIYQVFNDAENYRYEFTEDGTKGIVMVNPEHNQTSILIPDKKLVHLTTCDSRISRMNDPVASMIMYKKHSELKDEGEEKLGDFLCKKSSIYQEETKLFTVWQSEKLNFPIKIVNHYAKDTYMKLVNIKKWDVEENYFKVPEGYTEVDDEMRPVIPEPPTPEKWEIIEAVMPFEGKVKRGEKFSMTIPATDHFKIIARNVGDTPTKYIYHLYEKGEKLPWDKVGNDDRRTHRLYMGERSTFTYAWEEEWQLIVEVYEGEVELKIGLEKEMIN